MNYVVPNWAVVAYIVIGAVVSLIAMRRLNESLGADTLAEYGMAGTYGVLAGAVWPLIATALLLALAAKLVDR